MRPLQKFISPLITHFVREIGWLHRTLRVSLSSLKGTFYKLLIIKNYPFRAKGYDNYKLKFRLLGVDSVFKICEQSDLC